MARKVTTATMNMVRTARRSSCRLRLAVSTADNRRRACTRVRGEPSAACTGDTWSGRRVCRPCGLTTEQPYARPASPFGLADGQQYRTGGDVQQVVRLVQREQVSLRPAGQN